MSVSKQTTQILIITCVARESSIFTKFIKPNFCQISLIQHSLGLRETQHSLGLREKGD